MTRATEEALAYYSQPGGMTLPGRLSDLFSNQPNDLPGLVKVVQSSLVHVFWAERCGLHLSEEQKQTLQIRPVSQKLACMRETDPRPLTASRPLEQRQAGNCRDFSLLLCALLRHQGRPARARCGFGAYFLPGHYEDHWVCEVWDAGQERWVLVDAQIDAFQRQALALTFDPLDVPRDQFIVAGQAWQMCRAGEADPACFGIFDMNGIWFIWGNVVRDFLALNKVEILPWDWWPSPYWSKQLQDPPAPEHEMAFYDRLAALTLAVEESFPEVRRFYETEVQIQPPSDWYSP
jgi:hypothetical protein